MFGMVSQPVVIPGCCLYACAGVVVLRPGCLCACAGVVVLQLVALPGCLCAFAGVVVLQRDVRDGVTTCGYTWPFVCVCVCRCCSSTA